MRTLILVEHDNQTMQPSTRNVLAAALSMNAKPTLLVVGHQCQAVADAAARLLNVESVWQADNPCYEHQLPENMSQLITSLASSFDLIMAASTTHGKNLLPRVAAQLDLAQVSDVVSIIDKETFQRPIYAGNAIETVRVLDDKKILSIRTTAFEPVMETQPACCIEQIEKSITWDRTRFVEHHFSWMQGLCRMNARLGKPEKL